MKSSAFLAATGAVLAVAGPVRIQKRVIETDTVVEWFTVTVTDSGVEPTPTSTVEHTMWGPGAHHYPSHHPAATTSTSTFTIITTSIPEPPPSTVQPMTSTPEATFVAQTEVVVSSAPASQNVATSASTSTVASTAAQQALASPTDFASTAVYHHNLHRFNNSAGAVTWNAGYANSAAVLAATCNFHHNVTINGGGYGQNIAMWGTTDNPEALGANNAIAEATTNMWYNGEVNLFPSNGYGQANPDMTDFEKWGHYSQLVWKGSSEIGCAAQFCDASSGLMSGMGGWFTVCNYYPAGNMGGDYGANVFPPLGEATVTA